MFNLFKRTQQAVKKSRESWFSRVTNLFERSEVNDELWDELEELLITADVGIPTTTRIIQRTKEEVKRRKISTGKEAKQLLNEELIKILSVPQKKVEVMDKPYIILVIGVNGSGKTTTIAKLAYIYKGEGKKVILVAADTFRAAAIDQLKIWGERVSSEVIAHQTGGDPGAVVYDAIQAAKNRDIDVVIVDTAGRLHTKYNLMEELKKVKRVAAKINSQFPQESILVLDATTGQNGLSQAKSFLEAVGITGIILTKLDSTAKGGIVLAICDELKIPIIYIGTGEHLDDLLPFDATAFVEAISSPGDN